MPTSLVLKIDGNLHVVHFTALADEVVIRSIQFYNVVTDASQISKTLKFRLKNAVAEIFAGEVKCADVDVKS